MKREAVLGIMLALLLIGILTLTINIQPAKADPETIYVDDDNTTGPWDGTQEHPYQNITSALEHASVNDTIYVYNGTYHEHVTLDKSISLIGENKYNTIIDGSSTGPVIYVTANNTKINGFTIQNATNWSEYGIRVLNSRGNNISNNIITNNYWGIVVQWSSNDNILMGNTISSNFHTGIEIDHCDNNTFACNTISSNGLYGIFFGNLSSNHKLTGNNISNNAIGIYIRGFSYNGGVIFHNNFINNGGQVVRNWTEIYTDIWDNGYPSGGNYWSNYTGVDSNYDGIGDTPHVIDENNTDRYPLMNPWIPAETSVLVGGSSYPVVIVSNTTISQIATTANTLQFKSSGPTGEKGYINVIFPMVNTTAIQVSIDGNKLTPPPFPVINTNGTHYFIYFEFTLSNHTITIQFGSTTVGGIYIPVNKLELLAPYIGLTILLAVAVVTVGYVKKRKKNTGIRP